MKVLVLTFFILLSLTQEQQVSSEPTQVQKWLERKLEEHIRGLASAEYQEIEVLNNVLINGILRSLK